MLARSAFKPRRQNSGRQHDGKRFPKHLRWLRRLPCLIEGKAGHVCEGPIQTHHANEGSGGMSLKCPDFECVPLCFVAHDLVHKGKRTFEAKFGVTLEAAGLEYKRHSPHRHEWELPR